MTVQEYNFLFSTSNSGSICTINYNKSVLPKTDAEIHQPSIYTTRVITKFIDDVLHLHFFFFLPFPKNVYPLPISTNWSKTGSSVSERAAISIPAE